MLLIHQIPDIFFKKTPTERQHMNTEKTSNNHIILNSFARYGHNGYWEKDGRLMLKVKTQLPLSLII